MAIPVNIDELINGHVVESTRIEFKTSLNPNPVVHTICAFANDIDNIGGGYVILGVEEKDGSPVLPPCGIPQVEVDGVLKRLVGLCRHIEPLYNPIVEPILFQGAWVIVIWVPGGHGRPYKASKDVLTKRSGKQYFIRKFSSTIVASTEEERELFYASSSIPFDDQPNLAASVDDLDLGLMREHLKQTGSALYERSEGMGLVELAENLQLLAGPPEDRHPLNVGILMFSEHPERYFRYAYIDMVDLPDARGVNMVEKRFTGPIQRQLRDALAYLNGYAIQRLVVKDPDRAETRVVYNYPYAAVEEILTNAVYHRSYQIAEPVTVRITPDAMEVTSFPGFDRSISDEAVANHQIRARIYRNRRIGDFLKELHLAEGHNTGFPTAFDALRQNGSDSLAFEMDEARGYLSVRIPVHSAFGASKQDDGLLVYAESLLAALDERPLSLTELAHAMGYKGITKKQRDAVETLVQESRLKRIVDDSGRVKLSRF